MMGPQSRLLADGKRLHLHHGPIDLVIGAKGQVKEAFAAATARFQTVLDELVAELPVLRSEMPQQGLGLRGAIAQRMERAVKPFWQSRVTPMAAVAGSVAEEILSAMTKAADLRSAYVNNGGDIALHLQGDETFTIASPSGLITIQADDNVNGIATSGWAGRSFSLGLADSVTVLARTAPMADVAATLIANAVDLPGSHKVKRQKAADLAPDSDLGERLVTVGVETLSDDEIRVALGRGESLAHSFQLNKQIVSAAIKLQSSIVFIPNKQSATLNPWFNGRTSEASSSGIGGSGWRFHDNMGTKICA